MALIYPKKAKYRKAFRGRMSGVASRRTQLVFGAMGLKAKDRGWLTSRQIEAARRAMTHHTKRGGRIWIRIFPDKPITKKPAETRMGSGKGDVEEYVAVIRPGIILFEIGAVERNLAYEALKLASAKLPLKTAIIEKNGWA